VGNSRLSSAIASLFGERNVTHDRRRQRRRKVRTQARDLVHVGAERLGDVRESSPSTFGQDFRGPDGRTFYPELLPGVRRGSVASRSRAGASPRASSSGLIAHLDGAPGAGARVHVLWYCTSSAPAVTAP